MLCMAVVYRSIAPEHVGFSPTRQTLRAPGARRREVLGGGRLLDSRYQINQQKMLGAGIVYAPKIIMSKKSICRECVILGAGNKPRGRSAACPP